MDDYMVYPTDKMVGGRVVWCAVYHTTGRIEYFLPHREESEGLCIRVMRSARWGRVHCISGGTATERRRLLKKCEERGVRAYLARI